MSFDSLGILISPEGREQQKTLCPKCSAEREKNPEDKCLSVNIKTGNYNCHHCGWSGNIERKGKEYKFPERKEQILRDNVIKFFSERGISKETLEFMKVSSGIEYMPQVKKETGCILFNYYRDDVLVNVKYRDEKKNFKLHTGAELIMYNLDNIKDSDDVVICEGEIDALSFVEAGIPYAVSVPNGANLNTNNTEYLNTALGYLKGKKRIYLAVDNDEAGMMLKRDLQRRLQKERCYYVRFPDGIKDANELLKEKGADALHNLLATARPVPAQGVVYLDGEVEEIMLYEFHHGKERGTTTYHKCLDPHFNWKRSMLDLWHGVPNFGKSEFVREMCLIKSFREGDKWGFFAPEDYPANEFYDSLVHKFIGKNVDAFFGRQCSEVEYRQGMDFIREHFFYIDTEKTPTPQMINDIFGELIVKHGITGGVTDPWNQLYHQYQGREDEYLSQVLTEEKKFAKRNDFYKIIVAHPKQLVANSDGSFPVPNIYSLNGGAMWGNKVDNIMCVHRPNKHLNPSDPTVDIHIQKIKKQQLVGIPGKVTMTFHAPARRYVQSGVPHPLTLQTKQEEAF